MLANMLKASTKNKTKILAKKKRKRKGPVHQGIVVRK
jgi:hypothetical protein